MITMVLSMTGYGSDTFHYEETSVTVEIKTVNSRFLDFIPKLPRPLHHIEIDVKKMIQTYFHRGRVELFVTIEGKMLEQKKIQLNLELLEQYISSIKQVQTKYEIDEPITLQSILSLEDLFIVDEVSNIENDLQSQLFASIRRAAERVISSRKREGAFLREDMKARLQTVENMVKLIEETKEDVHRSYYERIMERVERFVGGKITLDETALLQEIALLAEKGDIEEEIIRLNSHLRHFNHVLEQQGPIGRKLDFIIQEMHREVNTIGAKAVDSTISESVVTLKSEIEKLKEQVQNVE